MSACLYFSFFDALQFLHSFYDGIEIQSLIYASLLLQFQNHQVLVAAMSKKRQIFSFRCFFPPILNHLFANFLFTLMLINQIVVTFQLSDLLMITRSIHKSSMSLRNLKSKLKIILRIAFFHRELDSEWPQAAISNIISGYCLFICLFVRGWRLNQLTDHPENLHTSVTWYRE